jgi:hypothetical protein
MIGKNGQAGAEIDLTEKMIRVGAKVLMEQLIFATPSFPPASSCASKREKRGQAGEAS